MIKFLREKGNQINARVRKSLNRAKRPSAVVERLAPNADDPETIFRHPDPDPHPDPGDDQSENGFIMETIKNPTKPRRVDNGGQSVQEIPVMKNANLKSDSGLSLPVTKSVKELRKREWGFSDFKHIRSIGKGQLGEVCKVYSFVTQGYFALKFVSKKKLEGNKMTEEDIFLEPWIQETANHKHILRSWGDFTYNTDFVFVMEYCPMGDLRHFLQQDPEDTDISKRARDFTRQIVSAVFYLQSKLGYIHMDLKPENILMADSKCLKVTDFGSAVRMVTYRHIHGIEEVKAWTTAYSPPEILKIDDVFFNSTVDVWSIGCIAYEMLTKTNPFFKSDLRAKKNLKEAGIPLLNINRSLAGKFDKGFFRKLEFDPHAKGFVRQIFVPFGRRPLVGQLEKFEWLTSRS